MSKKKKTKKRIINILKFHLPLILWAGFIFYLSSLSYQPVIDPKQVGVFNLALRKLVHLAEYAILYFLACRSFKSKKIKKYKMSAALFCFIFAITDEWHQSFIPGREGKVSDIIIDMAGVGWAEFFVQLKEYLLGEKKK